MDLPSEQSALPLTSRIHKRLMLLTTMLVMNSVQCARVAKRLLGYYTFLQVIKLNLAIYRVQYVITPLFEDRC